jgi:50S ribosomal protein L16 3-hydroxylase
MEAWRDVPEGFWRGFSDRYWEKEPVVFKQPCPSSIATEEELYRGFLAMQAHPNRSVPPLVNSIRVFLEKTQVLCDAREYYPHASDGSLHGYSRRMRGVRMERFGLSANMFQASSTILCARFRRFLRGLYGEVGYPTEPADVVCFFGNYGVSPFGVHTDASSVFSFIVAGSKRYRLFPMDALAAHPEIHYGSRYQPFLGRGLVLEGAPGDLIYWPSSYWHVGENESEESSATLNIAINLAPEPRTPAVGALKAALRKRRKAQQGALMVPEITFSGQLQSLPAVLERLVSDVKAIGDAFTIETRRIWLEQLSGVSLYDYQPPATSDSLTEEDWVRIDPEFPLLWSQVAAELIIASKGRSAIVPSCASLLSVLSALNQQDRACVRDLAVLSGERATRDFLQMLLQMRLIERCDHHTPER